MASSGPNSFVSIVKLEGATQLKGEHAARPLKPGQAIAAYGTFDDETETDIGFFMVLRSSKKNHTYELAPLGCRDPYWGKHLKGAQSITAKMMCRVNEQVDTKNVELLRRWQVLAEPKEKPPPSAFEALGKKGTEEAMGKWLFLSDYIVTDYQARQRPSFR